MTKRKYTDGYYDEFKLHREKVDKNKVLSEETMMADDSVAIISDSVNIELTGNFKIGEVTKLVTPVSVSYDSLLKSTSVKIAQSRLMRDTSWFKDTLPPSVEYALGGQALVGAGTVGALISMAAPEFIWVAWIFILAAPISMLVSIVSAMIAYQQISTGKIDKKYKRYMNLWAYCLLINLAIAAFVISRYTV